jgi:hypothetical protein
MPRYAVKIGKMRVTSDRPISFELRIMMLKAVREALASMDGELGEGCTLEFEVDDN